METERVLAAAAVAVNGGRRRRSGRRGKSLIRRCSGRIAMGTHLRFAMGTHLRFAFLPGASRDLPLSAASLADNFSPSQSLPPPPDKLSCRPLTSTTPTPASSSRPVSIPSLCLPFLSQSHLYPHSSSPSACNAHPDASGHRHRGQREKKEGPSQAERTVVAALSRPSL